MPRKIRISVPPKHLESSDLQADLQGQTDELLEIVRTVRPASIEVTPTTVKFIWTNYVVLEHNGGLRYDLGINLHPGHVSSNGIHGVDLGSIWTRTGPHTGEGASTLIGTLPCASKIRDALVEWLRADEKVFKLLLKKQVA